MITSRFKKGSMILVGVLAMLAYFGCSQQAWAYDEAATKALFVDKCAKCHGESGKGDGPKAKTLKKKPADYTDKAKMGEITDAELKEEITNGKKPMPAFKTKLTEQEIDDLVVYIRTFAK